MKKRLVPEQSDLRYALQAFLRAANDPDITKYIPDEEVQGCATGGRYAMRRRHFLSAVSAIRKALDK
jgi:hypothetical protein